MKTIDGVDKPLEEWTLKELKNCCSSHTGKNLTLPDGKILTDLKCYECCLRDFICSGGSGSFYDWDLSEKKKFTEQEVEDAKVLKRVFGDFVLIKAPNKVISLITIDRDGAAEDISYLKDEAFPSILPGEKVCANEILGDADA